MLPSQQDMDDFLDSVSDVARLIDGLKAGTISPDYVDCKIQAKTAGKEQATKAGAERSQSLLEVQIQDTSNETAETVAARQAELQRKVEELKASRQRKIKARQLFQQYVQHNKEQQKHSTDYAKWDLWCPSDEEDDLFNSLTPNSPEFRAMEKDIDDRHNRMVEKRQIAERQRQLGNAAFQSKQYSEALRCYEQGLQAQKHDLALHANAAMAALKLECYVQALDHCNRVLHLAEALHNQPQHPLCVKALQRRAAAYQALQQHSKAVADLEAAATMLPHDSELSAQLRRAKQQLQEHKTAHKLQELVAKRCAGETSHEQQQQQGYCKLSSATGSSSLSGTHDLAALQQISYLIPRLKDAHTAQGAIADSAAVVTACQELKGIIARHENFNIYFRECGGLHAAASLVPRLQDLGAVCACLQLLTAACNNAASLERLCTEHCQALAVALDLVATTSTNTSKSNHGSSTSSSHLFANEGSEARAASAAAELAYAASISARTRPVVAQQLLAKAQRGGSFARLHELWTAACQHGGAAQQVLVLSVLSNCLLSSAVRDATWALWQQRAVLVGDELARLAAADICCEDKSSRQQLMVAETLFGMISNLCSHAGMRKTLAEQQDLVDNITNTALSTSDASAAMSCQTAALGCLCNLSLEPAVQQQLAAKRTVECLLRISTLLHFEADISSSSSGRGAGVSPSSTKHSLGTLTTSCNPGQQPPHTNKNKLQQQEQHDQQQHQPTLQTEDAAARLQQSEYAALLLSRVARQSACVEVLKIENALHLLVSALDREKRQKTVQPAWVDAVVRTIAMLTATPNSCVACCSTEEAAALITACLDVLRSIDPSASSAAAKGNAALCLSHVAANVRWHGLLRQADAVQALVQAAYDGKGNSASKNAAIALAKMAKDEQMMDRLKELHGIEIIYQYVKP